MGTTLTGGTETVLTERPDKSTLNISQGKLTGYSLKWVSEASQNVWFTETWAHSFPAPTE